MSEKILIDTSKIAEALCDSLNLEELTSSEVEGFIKICKVEEGIEFETEVKLKSEPHIYKDGQWSEERLIAYIELPMGKNIVWRIKDKHQVFVVKKEEK